MAYGQIDPARLDGDALARWYLRSPADIQDERQAAAAQRYADFFGDAREPPNGWDSASADRSSPALDSAHFGQTGVQQVGYGASLGDGVYHPDEDSVQKAPVAATVWSCPSCHVPLPLPPQLQPLAPLLRNIPPSSGGASGRQWSDKPQCDQQFINDRQICQQTKSPKCWENQMERLAECNRTDLIGKPPLGFGPKGR